MNEQKSISSKRKIKVFIERIRTSLVRRINRLGILVEIGQFWNHPSDNQGIDTLKLLIVAPGNMPIPTDGWGAVEIVVYETLDIYAKAGFDVWVLNSKNRRKWKEAKEIDFSIILSHSDVDNPKIRSRFPEAKVIGVSHYGLGAYPEYWDKGFEKILRGMDNCDAVVCLSDVVAATFAHFISRDKIFVSPNGSSFQSFCEQPREYKKLICLGKVEKRKKQFELWKSLRTSSLEIIFAGPIADGRVLQQLAKEPSLSKIFIGAISRKDLATELGKYSGLIMISNGEADPLVLYEAQLAGLPVLVSERSLGSQDRKLNWVQVISDFPTAEEINISLSKVVSNSSVIANYASENYSWEVRNKNLVSLLLNFSNEK